MRVWRGKTREPQGKQLKGYSTRLSSWTEPLKGWSRQESWSEGKRGPFAKLGQGGDRENTAENAEQSWEEMRAGRSSLAMVSQDAI